MPWDIRLFWSPPATPKHLGQSNPRATQSNPALLAPSLLPPPAGRTKVIMEQIAGDLAASGARPPRGFTLFISFLVLEARLPSAPAAWPLGPGPRRDPPASQLEGEAAAALVPRP